MREVAGSNPVVPTISKHLRLPTLAAVFALQVFVKTKAMSSRNTVGAGTPEAQLRSFIDKFAPADQSLIRAVRAAVRKRMPNANELVWDNYNFFVIGYSPTERPSDSILSIAARANAVALYFLHGASLPDPKHLLLGSGKQVRSIRLESAEKLSHPDVEALIAAAIDQAKVRMPSKGGRKLIIRSVAVKQRPRRK